MIQKIAQRLARLDGKAFGTLTTAERSVYLQKARGSVTVGVDGEPATKIEEA